MQHLIFILPALGIVLFFIFPPAISIPLYILVLIISALIYWVLMKTMKRKPESGRENLIGEMGKVVSLQDDLSAARFQIKVRGELWSANSEAPLQPGDIVKIKNVDGIILVVEKVV
jgi:membrane-bound serine protease (ClpP class)